MLLVIGVLLGCGLTYAEYRKSTEILSIPLGGATVALAVPLYLNLTPDAPIVLADIYYAGDRRWAATAWACFERWFGAE